MARPPDRSPEQRLAALPPARSAEQRLAALEASARARRVQAAVKDDLKHRRLDLAGLLDRVDDDPAVAALHVITVLEALPRHGPRRASAALKTLRIAPSRRLRGLGAVQRAALAAYGTPRGTSRGERPSR